MTQCSTLGPVRPDRGERCGPGHAPADPYQTGERVFIKINTTTTYEMWKGFVGQNCLGSALQ